MSDSLDQPPRRSQIPLAEPGAKAAWDACVEKYGYPMTCPGFAALGYFSEGFRQGLIASEEVSLINNFRLNLREDPKQLTWDEAVFKLRVIRDSIASMDASRTKAGGGVKFARYHNVSWNWVYSEEPLSPPHS